MSALVELVFVPDASLSATPPGFPPSSYAIDDLVQGRPGAVMQTAVLTLSRVVMIAPGLWIAGQRRRLFRTSVIVSTMITFGMIGMKWAERRASADSAMAPSAVLSRGSTSLRGIA